MSSNITTPDDTATSTPTIGPKWTRLLRSGDSDSGRGIATDSLGNVYVVGYSEESIDGQPYSGNGDIFIMKF
jgi:hypothetical protein